MIVILDANALVADPALESKSWTELRYALNEKRARVVVPEFALIEAVATVSRKQSESVGAIRSQLQKWGRFGRMVIGNAAEHLNMTPQVAKELRDSLTDVGVEILRGPHVSHELIVRRAAMRVAPFDVSGAGYRDTLHWFFVLDIYQRFGDKHEVVFVSNDSDFEDPESKGRLHPDLFRDVSRIDRLKKWPADPGRICLLRSLSHVRVPAVYGDRRPPSSKLPATVALADAVVAAVRSQLPKDIDPKLTQLVDSVRAATVTDVTSAAVTVVSAQIYRYRPRVIGISFLADLTALMAAFASAPSQGIHLQHLLLSTRVSVVGRIDYDTESKAFSDPEVGWTPESRSPTP